MRFKRSNSKRSSLRVYFGKNGGVEKVDYRGIEPLKEIDFLRVYGSEAEKFKFALYELGVRNIIRPEDLFELAVLLKKQKEVK